MRINISAFFSVFFLSISLQVKAKLTIQHYTIANMKPEGDKDKKSKQKQRKVLLSQRECEVLRSRLPKNYMLVERNQWIEYVVNQGQLKAAGGNGEKTEKKEDSRMIAQGSREQLPNVPQQNPKIEVGTIGQASSSTPIQAKIQPLPSSKEQQVQQMTSQTSQQAIITHLLSKIVTHAEFKVILNSKMNPSAQQHINAINSQLSSSNYGLNNLLSDIDLLFSSFFQQIGPNQRASLFRDLVRNNIGKHIKRMQIQQQKVVKQQQQPQVRQRKEKIKQRSESEGESNNRSYSQSRDQSDQNIKSRLRGDALLPRDSYVSLTCMAALGFNIRKLSSEHLKWICLNFISNAKEKIGYRNSTFQLDLQTMPSEQFWRLESFVKKKLSTNGIPYDRPPAQQDDSFVIEDDTE